MKLREYSIFVFNLNDHKHVMIWSNYIASLEKLYKILPSNNSLLLCDHKGRSRKRRMERLRSK